MSLDTGDTIEVTDVDYTSKDCLTEGKYYEVIGFDYGDDDPYVIDDTGKSRKLSYTKYRKCN